MAPIVCFPSSHPVFVDVFKANYHGQVVAVKKWKPKGFGTDQQQLFQRELLVGRHAPVVYLLSIAYLCEYSKVNHPNLVRCVGYSTNPLALIMDFAPGRELFDILHDRKVVYTWAILKHMAIGIARGLQHLHALGAIHRDVKSPNVIVHRKIQVVEFMCFLTFVCALDRQYMVAESV